MTKVNIERSGSRTLITANGHATGSPQVCAAVSALLSALAGYVEYRKRACGGVEVLARELDEGRAKLHFKSKGRGRRELEGAVELVVTGLLQLQKSYGEYISVEFEKSKEETL